MLQHSRIWAHLPQFHKTVFTMESQCPFLDKLSPEIRISIYSHVFGPSLVIKPSSSDTALGVRKHQPEDTVYLQETDISLDTIVLVTSKQIYNEALLILYKDKIIRGTTQDFNELFFNSDFTELARHIRIADCISSYEDADFHTILCRLQSLPTVRSLTILSDCMYFQEDDRPHVFTVPRFCEEADLGEATCVDIGRYQLHGRFFNFQVAHRRLVQLWSSVKSTPDDYDPFEDLKSMQAKWPPRGSSLNFTYWYLQTYLRCWVGLLEELRREIGSLHHLAPHNESMDSPFLSNKRRAEMILEFEESICRLDVQGIHLEDDDEHAVLDCPFPFAQLESGHGHDWPYKFTELMSLKITAYLSEYDENNYPERRPRRAYWAETDGCMPTIEYMLMHQDIARAGLPDTHYIRSPVRPGEVLEVIDTAEFWIRDYYYMFRGIVGWSYLELSLFGALEKKQLASLRIALTGFAPDSVHHNDDYLNKWSAGLLRRYICASVQAGSAEVATLDGASSGDLRLIVHALLSVLRWDRIAFLRLVPEMRTFAPEGFLDDDLYEPFAWLFGPLLLEGCRGYFGASNLGLDWEQHLSIRQLVG